MLKDDIKECEVILLLRSLRSYIKIIKQWCENHKNDKEIKYWNHCLNIAEKQHKDLKNKLLELHYKRSNKNESKN